MALPNALRESLRTRLRIGSNKPNSLRPLMIQGPPGVGKSGIVATVCAEEKAELVDFRLILRDPTDLRGLPFPDFDKKVAYWLPPSELPNALTHKAHGILFLDDMPTAPPAVQASAYQLTLPPHKIGEYQLPEGWVIVAAGNRLQDRSLAHRIPPALANRFTFLDLEISKDEWTNWAAGHKIRPEVIAFMQSSAAFRTTTERGGGQVYLLFDFDPERDEHAFCSPRSWEGVSLILDAGMSTKVEAEEIEGTIGKAAASQFSAFRRLWGDVPDPDEILVKKNFLNPSKIDLKLALIASVASRAEEFNFDNAIQWAGKIGPEYGSLLIRMLASKSKNAVMDAPSFQSWARANRDFVLP